MFFRKAPRFSKAGTFKDLESTKIFEKARRFLQKLFFSKKVRNIHVNWLILKVHKIENFFYSNFGICVVSLLVMSKY
jgi:hypothetical protein